MGIIVKNGKFENSSVNEFPTKMDVASHTRVDELVNLVGNVPLLRINFPTSADGRGFSIAKTLRQYGYKGHIRWLINIRWLCDVVLMISRLLVIMQFANRKASGLMPICAPMLRIRKNSKTSMIALPVLAKIIRSGN